MGVKQALQDILPNREEIKEQVVKEGEAAKSFIGKVWDDIKHEAQEQLKHGSHEIASALFNGDAFVMYPHEGKQPEHGLPPEASKEQEKQREQDGMEIG